MTSPHAIDRQTWMAALARADLETLECLAADLAERPHTVLRRPETGMVMVRGRIGGSGDPFNLGEASVTRCAVRLPCGTVGHAYALGRDQRHAQLSALLDALLQTDESSRIKAQVIVPLVERQSQRKAARAAAAAVTRVDFFTMVRGDD